MELSDDQQLVLVAAVHVHAHQDRGTLLARLCADILVDF